jgi:thioredoxin reductase (NADPH)
MTALTDSRPALILVCEDAENRAATRHALERWFANDYRIVDVATPAAATEVLDQLRGAGTEIALVIADQQNPSESGVALLGRLRDVLPTARRALLVAWEGNWDTPTIARASVLGDIDHVVGWPWSVNDDQFLATIGDLLADWATEHGRYVESSRLLAEPDDGEAQVLRDTVLRWAVPLGYYETGSEYGGQLARELPRDGKLPAVFLPDGTVLSRPTVGDIANAFGANANLDGTFDVAVIGSGPAGMAAAVNAVSEGLRTLIIEVSALGGQASSSPLIRNYLGFPGGISGAGLMTRALRQAWVFGVELQIGKAAVDLVDDGDHFVIHLDDGSAVRARSVVLAMGVTYRRLGITSVERLFGRGVFYGAGATEGPGVVGGDVFIVGGGNSGAQATVNLARYARHATLVVRGDSLDSVSDYLIEQLQDRSNIDVLLNTEVVDARGDGHLRSVVLRNGIDGTQTERDAVALFILIGATPRTDWLPASIERDPRGYILTGPHAGPHVGSDPWHSRPTLETRMPGVFAAGDVRHDSIKRVAAAVGEGATAIREVHGYLGASRPVAAAAAR